MAPTRQDWSPSHSTKYQNFKQFANTLEFTMGRFFFLQNIFTLFSIIHVHCRQFRKHKQAKKMTSLIFSFYYISKRDFMNVWLCNFSALCVCVCVCVCVCNILEIWVSEYLAHITCFSHIYSLISITLRPYLVSISESLELRTLSFEFMIFTVSHGHNCYRNFCLDYVTFTPYPLQTCSQHFGSAGESCWACLPYWTLGPTR